MTLVLRSLLRRSSSLVDLLRELDEELRPGVESEGANLCGSSLHTLDQGVLGQNSRLNLAHTFRARMYSRLLPFHGPPRAEPDIGPSSESLRFSVQLPYE